MNKFANWLYDESDHHLSRGTTHFIGDKATYSVQTGMIFSADEIEQLSTENSALRALLKDLLFDIDDDELVDWAKGKLAMIDKDGTMERNND